MTGSPQNSLKPEAAAPEKTPGGAGSRPQTPEKGPQKPRKRARSRLVARCSAEFLDWAAGYAEYVQISVADLVAQALLRHAEMTGYATEHRPPQRVYRQRRETYRPPGPWPERPDR